MSCSQFISNLEGLNDGQDFPKDLLKVCRGFKHSHTFTHCKLHIELFHKVSIVVKP